MKTQSFGNLLTPIVDVEWVSGEGLNGSLIQPMFLNLHCGCKGEVDCELGPDNAQ